MCLRALAVVPAVVAKKRKVADVKESATIAAKTFCAVKTQGRETLMRTTIITVPIEVIKERNVCARALELFVFDAEFVK